MTTMSTQPSTSDTGLGEGRVYNFSAGPAVLPEPVLKQAQQDLWNIFDSGVGILEHSHRGKVFDRVIDEAEADIRQLAGISDDYHVLFLQGGASSQFFMIPMNFAGTNIKADYFDTGKWSEGAIKEGKTLCDLNIVASSKGTNFDRIPDAADWSFSDDAAYCHFTSNNTIAGTQWQTEPKHPGGAWLACDASSDIFSRPIDVSKYGLIYAGAQKNLGPSGTVLAIIRKDLCEAGATNIPTMLRYKTHADKGSRYHTPPTFGIYMIGQVAKWILAQGGLEAMHQHNQDKAAILYDFLDQSDIFNAHAQPSSRSLMNISFRTADADLDKRFLDEAKAGGFDGLKGHRSVGGMRASIYNAFPRQGVSALVEFMKGFERASK